jgi:hypothetical protein
MLLGISIGTLVTMLAVAPVEMVMVENDWRIVVPESP